MELWGISGVVLTALAALTDMSVLEQEMMM